jgi:hypothetical protein
VIVIHANDARLRVLFTFVTIANKDITRVQTVPYAKHRYATAVTSSIVINIRRPATVAINPFTPPINVSLIADVFHAFIATGIASMLLFAVVLDHVQLAVTGIIVAYARIGRLTSYPNAPIASYEYVANVMRNITSTSMK